MPALEPLHGLRVVADPAALDAARWDGAADGDRSSSCGSPRTRRSPSGRRRDARRPGRDRRGRARVRRGVVSVRRRSARQTEWSPPADAPGPRPGLHRRRAGQGLAAGRRRRARRRDRGPRRRPGRDARMAAMTVREPARRHAPADPLAGPPEGVVRRRHHRRRRTRPVDRLLPRDPPRDHERGGRRGRLHRLRQHRPEHDDHPRQLRHPAGGPLLQAQPGHVRGARGRDGRRTCSTRPRGSCGAPTPR